MFSVRGLVWAGAGFWVAGAVDGTALGVENVGVDAAGRAVPVWDDWAAAAWPRRPAMISDKLIMKAFRVLDSRIDYLPRSSAD
ncbi:hypothetical protein Are01nite_70480 [Actinoplanes regularis]|nr:hypothetical protein Are01nite_70480 [Actinoplanes regularis]